ncbi:MAG: FAD-binding oxidoreductase [Hyphomicrobiaceae bacterium]
MREVEGLLTEDFRDTPYWWRAAPRPLIARKDLEKAVDVVVVGAGITGLNAAIELTKAGRSVAVLDAGDAGAGASSRNAGFVGRTLKHSFGQIARKNGLEQAKRVYREMQAAFESVADVITQERIDCHYERCGRLIMLQSQSQRRALEAELTLRAEHLGQPFRMVEGHELGGEIATGSYVAAAVIPDLASIHPGLYHLGLLKGAEARGAVIHTETEVKSIERTGEGGGRGGFTLGTSRGPITAGEVIVATNGYTDKAWPWLARRAIPFDAYMIATEELSDNHINHLLPGGRTYLEDTHNIFFVRRAPDSRRILFGGRTGSRFPSLTVMAERLRGDLNRMLPELGPVRIANAWTGRCSGSFDLYPHFGRHDGIHYALGYCFAGVPMGTYLGRKAAASVLGRPDRETVFAERRFTTVPGYTGNPWFVPAVMAYWDWQDRRSARK